MEDRWRGNGALLAIGVVLVFIGGVFLLRNAGILFFDWWFIWPLLLIVIGVVVLAGALGMGSRGPGERAVSLPRDTVTRLDLSMRIGAGRYRLAAATGSTLVEATSDQPTIAMAADRAGDLARVRLSTAVERWSWGWTGGHSWAVAVAPDVPTALDVQAGAGSFELDLSALSITSVRISIGAADLSVVLPRPRGEVRVQVEGGAAQFTFRVPPGVQARISTTGLVSTSGPTETPGYAAAADRVTVVVTGGLASVRVINAG